MEVRSNHVVLISAVASVLLLVVVSHATMTSSVVSLSSDNFYKETQGKTAFIKFFAPWCGHCKAMAGDWEKLAETYKQNDKNLLIAEVDCTKDDNMELCQDVGVQGYPTILYGDALDLEGYKGARDYDSFASFAEQLKPPCSSGNLDLCDEESKEAITKVRKMTNQERLDAIKAAQDLMAANEEWYESEEDKIQHLYDELVSQHEAKLRRIKKEKNLKFLKLIRATRTKVKDTAEE